MSLFTKFSKPSFALVLFLISAPAFAQTFTTQVSAAHQLASKIPAFNYVQRATIDVAASDAILQTGGMTHDGEILFYDFNGNGKPEIIYSYYNWNRPYTRFVECTKNTNNENFTCVPVYEIPDFFVGAIGDFDNDGNAEVFGTYVDPNMTTAPFARILEQTGYGTFPTSILFNRVTNIAGIKDTIYTGDINGNGLKDLMYSRLTGAGTLEMRFEEYNGAGGLTHIGTISNTDYFPNPKIGNLNNGGGKEIAVLSQSIWGTFEFFSNFNIGLTFANGNLFAVNTYDNAILPDLDQDGLNEYAVVARDGNIPSDIYFEIWEATGAGSTNYQQVFNELLPNGNGSPYIRKAILGGFTRKFLYPTTEKKDLIVTDGFKLFIYENMPDASSTHDTYVRRFETPAAPGPVGLTSKTLDIDGDGKPEIIFNISLPTGPSPGQMAVFETL